jgi:AbiTii
VRTQERTLLDQIQTGALDSSVPLADTLRKVVALGGETGSEELRGWASRELRGYGGSDVELPEYRRPAAPLKVDAFKFNAQITGQSISPRQLPDFVAEKLREEVPLSAGIGEIEAMLKRAREGDGSVKLMPPMAQDIVRYMNHEIQNHPQGDPYQQITELYWVVSQVTLEGVVDQVRTTLVELVAEMRAEMSDEVDTPPAEIADRAVQYVVTGKRPTINVTNTSVSGSGSHQVQSSGAGSSNAQASGEGSHTVRAAPLTPASQATPWWKSIWGILIGFATMIGALAGVGVWVGWGPL